MSDSESTLVKHWQIAEQGKVHALAKEYDQALSYYRLAIRQASEVTGHELLARHYAECALEVLEKTDSHEEVLAYCEQALEYYRENPPEAPAAIKDQASLHERRAIALMKLEENEEALEEVERALSLARSAKLQLPVARQLQDWLRRGLAISRKHLEDLLDAKNHYTVRDENVDRDVAVILPEYIVTTPS